MSRIENKFLIEGVASSREFGEPAGFKRVASNLTGPFESAPRGAVSVERFPCGSRLILKVRGRFDFRIYEEFRAAYKAAWRPGVAVEVELSALTALDSSALGILLLLREFLGEGEPRARIKGCSPEIRAVFRRAHFEDLFLFDQG